MWSEGVVGISQGKNAPTVHVHYWMKRYKEPSKFGIDGGRISKLTLKIGDEIVANYDRGWDIRPRNEIAEKVLYILVHEIDWREKDEN